ncbi:2260_t:CDS:1 [Cetraspora pellucida]|uniref:2260_t:CDS:1 n=1 Tax=Cetraspora pellucida TaxID=1433469 RepID=A0ACA9L704_9GLOM|nr:2260_t:CDS:1 [Cetraspora pellucida]
MPPKNIFLKHRCNATQACDSCKRSKNKCSRLDQSTKCSRCTKQNIECTYLFQQGKRGPKREKCRPKPRKHDPRKRKPTPPLTLILPSNNTPLTTPPSNITPSHNNNHELHELLRDLFFDIWDHCEV